MKIISLILILLQFAIYVTCDSPIDKIMALQIITILMIGMK